MREERRRRLAAQAALVVSTMALLATSYSPTARGEASGEMTIAPDAPGRVEVRFGVTEDGADQIERISVWLYTRSSNDRRVSVATDASIVGTNESATSGQVELDPAACRRGCEIEASITVSMVSPGEAALDTDWHAEITLDYESDVPNSALTTTVARPGSSSPPRATWVAAGIALAALGGAGSLALGRRFPVLRLVVAGGLLVIAAWPLAWSAPYLFPGSMVQLDVDWEMILVLAGGVVVLVGVAVGLWRARNGRPTVLRVVGTLAALVVGFSWWRIVEVLPAYRAHEVALYTLGVMLPAAAAVTAPTVGDVAERSPRTVAMATSLVIAAHVIIGLAVLSAAASAITFVVTGAVNVLTQPGRTIPIDPVSATLVIVPIAVAWQFIIGLRAWRRGRWLQLFLADAPVALVVAAGTIFVLLQSERGLLAFDTTFRVFTILVAIVVLVGTAGLPFVPPPIAGSSAPAPPTDGDREEQRGQRDEIGRVADEGHRTQVGERPRSGD